MAYRIEYDRAGGKFEVRREYPWRFPMLLLAAGAGFLLLTASFWPEGAAYLREALIPGKNQETLEAVKLLTADLRSGAGLGEAVESFCRLVLHGPQG